MTKPRPSLEALAGAVAPTPPTPPAVVVLPRPGATPRSGNRPHMSLYLPRKVTRVIKKIAADLDCKPHDLLVEGIDLMLRRYGKPTIEEIERGDAATS